MKGKIAVEEHFAVPETVENPRNIFSDESWSELRRRLLDLHDQRLRQMDMHGVETMVLSLNSPTVQAVLDPGKAAALARRANDYLAEQVSKNPSRFQGLAALPMQDPELAIAELERCVAELGFKGALVNGFSQVGEPGNALYYDLPRYRSFWAAVERLDVPFYLHPRSSLPPHALYDGHAWLHGAAWGFGNETAVHALRLMGSGLFDEYPRLSVVIGHMGEGLPFAMWRVDNCNGWAKLTSRHSAKHEIAHYFASNFYVTTSGNFRTQALINTILELGADRIMFSIDWPFENVDHAANWFDSAAISEGDRQKIGRSNAARLFKLGLD
jgi:predicted TIM-barrel fold metal-dependent hydrolase